MALLWLTSVGGGTAGAVGMAVPFADAVVSCGTVGLVDFSDFSSAAMADIAIANERNKKNPNNALRHMRGLPLSFEKLSADLTQPLHGLGCFGFQTQKLPHARLQHFAVAANQGFTGNFIRHIDRGR